MTESKCLDERRNKKKRKLIKGAFFPFTRDLRESEAYKCLSCRAVKILIESVPIGGGAEPWKWTSDEIFPIVYKPFQRYMGRKQFYAARKETVDYGFFEVVDSGGLGHKKTIFRKDVQWQSISSVLKEEKDKKAHSEKMKRRFKDSGLEKPKEEKKRDFLDEL